MDIFLIIAVLLFAAALCIKEIPDMMRRGLNRELAVFSVILVFGVTVSILKILGTKIPNPNDIIVFSYSHIVDLLKGVLEP